MIKSLVLMTLTTILFFILHIAIFRMFKVKRRFLTIFGIFSFSVLIYIALFWSSAGEALRNLVPFQDPFTTAPSTGWNVFFCVNGIMYSFFIFLGYLEVYFTADRSITIRIMIEIFKHPDKAMTMDQFKGVFQTEEKIFNRRFDEMVLNGYLRKDDTHYRLTPLGVLAAWYNNFLIRLINLEGG